MSRQKPTTSPSRSIDLVDRERNPIEPVGTPTDQRRGETDNGRSQERANHVNSAHTAEKLASMFPNVGLAESRMTQLGPLSYQQPNQHCRHPIKRNSLLRGFSDRRSPLQCIGCTHMVTRLRFHIPHCREDPSLCADREAEPPGFWTGRTRSTH